MSSRYNRLLVPVNGTPADQDVLHLVGDLVHRHPASITLIFVVEVQQSLPLDAELPDQIDRGEKILRVAEDFARRQLGHKVDGVTTDLLQARSAGSAIVDEAIERRADVIVLSAENRCKLGRTSLGETVAYILKNAPCDVLVVRQAPV